MRHRSPLFDLPQLPYLRRKPIKPVFRIAIVERGAPLAAHHLFRIAEGLAADALDGAETQKDQDIDPPTLQARAVAEVWREWGADRLHGEAGVYVFNPRATKARVPSRIMRPFPSPAIIVSNAETLTTGAFRVHVDRAFGCHRDHRHSCHDRQFYYF